MASAVVVTPTSGVADSRLIVISHKEKQLCRRQAGTSAIGPDCNSHLIVLGKLFLLEFASQRLQIGEVRVITLCGRKFLRLLFESEVISKA